MEYMCKVFCKKSSKRSQSCEHHVTSTRQIEHYFSEKESTIIVQSPIIDSLLILGKGIAYIEYTQS